MASVPNRYYSALCLFNSIVQCPNPIDTPCFMRDGAAATEPCGHLAASPSAYNIYICFVSDIGQQRENSIVILNNIYHHVLQMCVTIVLVLFFVLLIWPQVQHTSPNVMIAIILFRQIPCIFITDGSDNQWRFFHSLIHCQSPPPPPPLIIGWFELYLGIIDFSVISV